MISHSFFLIANLLDVLYLGVKRAVVGRVSAVQAVQAAEGPVKPVENRRLTLISSSAARPSVNSNSSEETSRKQSFVSWSSLSVEQSATCHH